MPGWTKALLFILVVLLPLSFLISKVVVGAFDDRDTGLIVSLALNFIVGCAGGLYSTKWISD